MSYYLGISSLDCDATVTVVKEGRIVYAAQEERFTRVKQQSGFPYHAIEDAFRYLGITISDIASIGYGWFAPKEERKLYLRSGKKAFQDYFKYKPSTIGSFRHIANIHRRGRIVNYSEFKKFDRLLQEGLKKIGYSKPLKRYHHQLCHVASAYYTSGFEKSLIVSLDGYGSGCAGSIYIGEGTQLRRVLNIPSPQSLGVMYAKVTRALGFTPNRHEGKILGLAAYGDPDKYYDEIRKDFKFKDGRYVYLNSIDPYKYKSIFQNGSREDLAAAFQKVLENIVVEMVRTNLKEHGLNRVCLAGGVAANVKMNQRVMEIPECEEIFIHPGMSDCGIGTGAAFLMASEEAPIKPYKLDNVFFGPDFSEEDIQKSLAKFSFEYTRFDNIEEEVARRLSEGSVVGLFQGRMEYGPRALCNRTILAPTQDNGINKWLNKRLQRTEFMPFAPVTLDYMVDEMYKNTGKLKYTAQFMTITTDCTDAMKKNSPAAVHVDGTARPQIVSKENNSRMFKILDNYYKLTGVPNLVNTSFNMHEEPIVCTPYDALKGFQDGRLDYLALGNYLVEAQTEEK